MPIPIIKKRSTLQAVAILEVMWDWEAMTSDAGYTEIAPPWFSINPNNFTGARLYELLGHGSLLVTNACKELVNNASGRGTPDPAWLEANVKELYRRYQFNTLLVCGGVAKATFKREWLPDVHLPNGVKVIYMPHPAWRMWSAEALELAANIIRTTLVDVVIHGTNDNLPHERASGTKRRKQKRQYKGLLFE